MNENTKMDADMVDYDVNGNLFVELKENYGGVHVFQCHYFSETATEWRFSDKDGPISAAYKAKWAFIKKWKTEPEKEQQ